MSPSPDLAILRHLAARTTARAAEIGIFLRMTAGEVRSRLAGLESQRLAPGAARAGVQGERRGSAKGGAMIPTGFQIRAARELVGMTQDALGKAAGVGLGVIVHAELVDRAPTFSMAAAAIQGALEARGIRFLWEDGGIGVELRKVEP